MTQTRSPALFVVGLVLLSTLSVVPAAAGAASPAAGPSFQMDDNETGSDGPTFDDNETAANATGTAQTTGETVQVSNATVDALKNQTARIAYYIEGLKNRTVYQVNLFEGLPESVSQTGDQLSSLSDEPSAERNNTIDAIRSDLDDQRETILRYRVQTQWQYDVVREYLDKIEELNQTVESISDPTVQEALQKHLGFHAREARALRDNLAAQLNASRTALKDTIALDRGLGELRNQTAPETPTPGSNDSGEDTPIFEGDDESSRDPFADEVSVSDLTPLQNERAAAVENISTKLDEQIEIVRNLDAYLAQATELVAAIENGEVPDPSQVEPVSTPTTDGTDGDTNATDGDSSDDDTPTADDSSNGSDDGTNDSSGTGAIGPGFAPLTALVAVALAVAIVLARRRRQ